jgi:hypothetical protein
MSGLAATFRFSATRRVGLDLFSSAACAIPPRPIG